VAGRKQQFIPQALQRGFGQAKEKKTQVYVFKKRQELYLSSTEALLHSGSSTPNRQTRRR